MILAQVLWMAAAMLSGEEWGRFRGPNGSGISEAAGYPVEFSKEKNVVWRTAVRMGKSSPVLTKRHVFLTSYEDGKLYTHCLDRATGKQLWERWVERADTQIANRLNHPAAITPVTDGENVYVFFKDFGMVAYDAAGREKWKTRLGPFTSTMGLGAAPVWSGGKVVLLADQSVGSFVAAFDGGNGEMKWKAEREEAESWGTPVEYRSKSGKVYLLTASRGQLGAYDARGRRVMSVTGVATTVVGSPVVEGDVVYVFGSEQATPFSRQLTRFDKNGDGKVTRDEFGEDAVMAGIARFRGNRDWEVTADEWEEWQKKVMGPDNLMAFRLSESGTGTDAPRLEAKELWRYEKGFTGVIPSALVYRGVVYVVKNGGILMTFDAKDGKLLRTGRLTGALGGYSSSPVAAEGRVYLASEEGKVTVLKAGADWEVLAVNDLGEGCYGTAAMVDGEIYLRTSEALYRFAKRE